MGDSCSSIALIEGAAALGCTTMSNELSESDGSIGLDQDTEDETEGDLPEDSDSAVEEEGEAGIPAQAPGPFVPQDLAGWVPRTILGRKVADGEVTSLREIFLRGERILETEIIDILLPGFETELIVLDAFYRRKRVARRDRSGRKYQSKTAIALGNRDGFVGLGVAKDKETYLAIQKAIKEAKKNIIMVRRGCGSWDCACSEPHSIPFRVSGKSGSVRILLKPSSKGVGLVVSDRIKPIFVLAGIEDIYSRTTGRTKTTENMAKATIKALEQLWNMKPPKPHEGRDGGENRARWN